MTTGTTTKVFIEPMAWIGRAGAGQPVVRSGKKSRGDRWGAFAASVVLLVPLTGCIGDMPHRGAWDAAPELAPVRTASLMADDYVYYPRYAIYFNRSRQRYISLESDGWATRPEPAGVAMAVLLDSPSVPLAFHDAPGQHHDQVVRDYPKNWPLSGVAVVGPRS